MNRGRIAFCAALLLLLGAPAAAVERPYNGSDGNVTRGNWTDDHQNMTIKNVSHYLSRVGTFAVGGDPSDAGVGPIITGVFVAGLAIAVMGTSRSGVVASGTVGVVVIAALSAPGGAGFLPRWLYGVVVMLVAFVAATLYVRLVR